ARMVVPVGTETARSLWKYPAIVVGLGAVEGLAAGDADALAPAFGDADAEAEAEAEGLALALASPVAAGSPGVDTAASASSLHKASSVAWSFDTDARVSKISHAHFVTVSEPTRACSVGMSGAMTWAFAEMISAMGLVACTRAVDWNTGVCLLA